jgi:parallel beta-helix repeat protein
MYNCDNSSPTLTNCTFSGNWVRGQGGGMYNCDNSSPTLTNCTFSGNSDGGMYNCDNSSPTLTNCILWANESEQISGDAAVTYSDVQGGWPGEGNIDTDPLFADLGYWDPNGTPADESDDYWINGDYHLKSQAGRWDPNSESWVQDDTTSPCIDAGDPLSPVMYEPHQRGCFINMGAYGGTEEASKSPFGCSYEADDE